MSTLADKTRPRYKNTFPVLEPEEAAALVSHRQTVGFSGFTAAGAAKAVPRAIAAQAARFHEDGSPYSLGVITGASTGDALDGSLARANAIAWRTPYQSNKDLRERINKGEARFFDMHLSLLPQQIRYGFMGKLQWAVVEACDVSAKGEICLTTSVGVTPTICHAADKIIVEVNRFHHTELRGIHDIYEPQDPPYRREIPVFTTRDRIGSPFVKVDPSKIAGIVYNDEPDETGEFRDSDVVTRQIGKNVADFLARELGKGHIPPGFLPIQSGVGNIANAVLGELAAHPEIPPFDMYSEVVQDSVIELIESERIRFASGTSLTVSPRLLKKIYNDLAEYRKYLLLRPQEISNNPEIVRRLGVISINTALETDIFGNVNSTHLMGQNMMNGIGGSGDFTRNAYISIFTCPSTAKGGKISSIVPLVSHMDHSEHSVQVIVTEQGVADLRKKDPHMRARTIISNCAHPDFQEELHGFTEHVREGHSPQTLSMAHAMHQQFLRTGDMRDVDWGHIARMESE